MSAIEKWHRIVEAQDLSALPDLLAEDAAFHSPIVHTPQVGRDLVMMYLTSARQSRRSKLVGYRRPSSRFERGSPLLSRYGGL